MEYIEFYKPCKVVHRYSKQNLLDANYNENVNVFIQTWLTHKNRQEYTDVDFKPDLSTPLML